jgi:signal transduction histidine kinase
MPSVVDSALYKYLLIPTQDGRNIIKVFIEIQFVDQLLLGLLNEDSNIEVIQLAAPTGKIPGQYKRKNGTIQFDNSPEDIQKNSLQNSWFTARVKATVDSCCECVEKGLTKSRTDPFHYEVRLRVSANSLVKAKQGLIHSLLILGLLLLTAAAIVSRVIAKKLSTQVETLLGEIEKIKTDESHEIAESVFKGDLEFSSISQQINSMLKKLAVMKRQQAELARAEAVAKIASQVSHDIRSPLAALEVVLRDLGGLSEEYRRISSILPVASSGVVSPASRTLPTIWHSSVRLRPEPRSPRAWIANSSRSSCLRSSRT